MLYQKNIRAMNPRATIYLDDVDGNSEDYNRNMPLPFDVDADVIDIAPADYGLWYIDAMGDPGKYDGKTVRSSGRCMWVRMCPRSRSCPAVSAWSAARGHQFLGFICRYDGAADLKLRDWVRVTATITVEALPQYRGEGPGAARDRGGAGGKAEEELVYFN